MRILIIKIGDPLPIDPGKPRVLRAGLIAEQLVRRGHEVTFWSSTMEHHTKTCRFECDTEVAVHENYKLVLAYAPPFENHLSLQRVRHQNILASKLKRDLAKGQYDVVLCTYPTIELSHVAVQHGLQMNVPVVVDIRDLWPDIIPFRLSRVGNMVMKPLMMYWTHLARQVFRKATAITGVTPEIVQWGLGYAKRSGGEWDQAFYHGYPKPTATIQESQAALNQLAVKGIQPDSEMFTICYIGHLTKTIEFETAARAFEQLYEQKAKVRLIVCGAGDYEPRFRVRTNHLPNVIFGGWVGSCELWELMKLSQMGIFCYHSTFDFESSIPNKLPEYFAGGLPVLSSIQKGVPKELLDHEKVGFTYEIGNPSSLRDILIRCSQNPKLISQMSSNALELYERRFRADRVYSEMSDYLEAIVQARAASSRQNLSDFHIQRV